MSFTGKNEEGRERETPIRHFLPSSMVQGRIHQTGCWHPNCVKRSSADIGRNKVYMNRQACEARGMTSPIMEALNPGCKHRVDSPHIQRRGKRARLCPSHALGIGTKWKDPKALQTQERRGHVNELSSRNNLGPNSSTKRKLAPSNILSPVSNQKEMQD